MDHLEIARQLKINAKVYKGLFTDLNEEEYLWREEDNKWSLLEVLCHLRDEELEDWQTRTKFILDEIEGDPPPIHPEAWVKERNYQSENFLLALEEFLKRRNQSIQWLETVQEPNWTLAYEHPKLGVQSARLFLENWLAHDYLHIRQINKIKYNYLKKDARESLSYAGEW
ncbi:MAG: DinB family protein [Bacteroidota bacterium]